MNTASVNSELCSVRGNSSQILVPLTDPIAIRAAFERLQSEMVPGAEILKRRFVGHRGGGRQSSVHWWPDDGFWGVFELPPGLDRYWICWGVQDPSETMTITLETNVPHGGFDRACAGAFVHDGREHVYLAHSGRIGGGRRGIGKHAFRAFADGLRWKDVAWPDGTTTEMIIIARLGSPTIRSDIAAFVNEVSQFKQSVLVNGTASGTAAMVGGRYTALFEHLSALRDDVWEARFSDIESIIGRTLPASARKHPAWWANDRTAYRQSTAWLEAGWETGSLNIPRETVVFRRSDVSDV